MQALFDYGIIHMPSYSYDDLERDANVALKAYYERYMDRWPIIGLPNEGEDYFDIDKTMPAAECDRGDPSLWDPTPRYGYCVVRPEEAVTPHASE